MFQIVINIDVMLEIKNLHAEVDGTEILKGVDLKINPGEVHAIMGPNGSGKSTLSYVLSGKDGYKVTGGRVELNGSDILELDPEERAALGLFLAFQYGANNIQTMVYAQTKDEG